MRSPQIRPRSYFITARQAWIGLAAYVLIIDTYLAHHDDSMSKQFLAWPLVATIPITTYLVCHLNQQPRKLIPYDPLNRLANLLRGKG